MNLSEYCEKARSTAIYSGPVYYPTLGLCGESGELIDKLTETGVHHSKDEITKEMGDVLWYVVNDAADAGLSFLDVCSTLTGGQRADNFTELGAQMKTSDDRRVPTIKLPIYAGRVAEVAKKQIRDSGGTLPAEKKQIIADSLPEVLRCLFEIAAQWSINLDDVAQVNIDKLFSRKERGQLQGSGDNR